MKVKLPYGEGYLDIAVPDICRTDIVHRNEYMTSPKEKASNIISLSINNAVGNTLEEIIKNKASKLRKNVSELKSVIVVSDSTRPVPNDIIVDQFIRRLTSSGLLCSNITVLIACGKHKQPYNDEIRRIVGTSIPKDINIIAHEAGKSEVTFIGTTSYGTDVYLDNTYIKADVRIITGMIEAHQLAGFSGGAKSVFIGLGGEQTISHNHSLLLSPMAKMGILDGNPIREDMEEGLSFIGVDFILNVVLDSQKNIIKAFAGTYPKAYRDGVKFAAESATVYFKEPADICIVSCGGHPKDINMYQAQKALAHIDPMVKPGGFVILLARCPDGLGEGLFKQWMYEAASPQDVLDRFQREGFILGAHKAFLLARSLNKFKTFLISDLDEETVRKLFFIPASTAQQAVDEAVEQCRNAGIANPSVILVPQGIGILPKKH